MSIQESQRWGKVIRFCHWLTLILVVAAWLTMEIRHEFPKGSDERNLWMMWHITVGLSIWFLTVFRLGWRAFQSVPHVDMPVWQRWAARIVQAFLYIVLLAMPIFGIATRQFAERSISYAGLIDMPQLSQKNMALAEWFGDMHEDVLWPALLILVGAHAAAALWHQFAMRDNLIGRMFWSKR